MKKIIAIMLATLMLVCSLVSCGGSSSDLEAIQDAGKIVIGVTVYPPMDYLDDQGEWTGFDAELAKKFAESLGVNCQIVIITWSNKVADLDTNQIDLVWNGMTASDDLADDMDFSVSYAKNAQVAVVKKGSGITKADLTAGNVTVAVENGSAGETVARETLGITDSKLVESLDGQTGAVNEVNGGTSDVAVIDLTMAQSIVGKGDYSDLEIIEGAQYGEEIFAVGMRKGSDLKEKVDAFLKDAYKDGTMAALVATKYPTVVINEDALK